MRDGIEQKAGERGLGGQAQCSHITGIIYITAARFKEEFSRGRPYARALTDGRKARQYIWALTQATCSHAKVFPPVGAFYVN